MATTDENFEWPGPVAATYPQHDRLQKTAHERQAIVDFLNWAEEQDMGLAANVSAYPEDWGLIFEGDLRRLLAEYYEIDLDELQAEKERMLAAVRAPYNPQI